MLNLLKTAAAVAAASLCACASAPDDVRPLYTSSVPYQELSCDQLAQKVGEIGDQVDKVTGQQTTKRRTDQAAVGVGVILFVPALLVMLTPDHKKELAKLKGQYEAVQRAAESKHCALSRPA